LLVVLPKQLVEIVFTHTLLVEVLLYFVLECSQPLPGGLSFDVRRFGVGVDTAADLALRVFDDDSALLGRIIREIGVIRGSYSLTTDYTDGTDEVQSIRIRFHSVLGRSSPIVGQGDPRRARSIREIGVIRGSNSLTTDYTDRHG
jgi:hypothetical protein